MQFEWFSRILDESFRMYNRKKGNKEVIMILMFCRWSMQMTFYYTDQEFEIFVSSRCR